MVLVFVPTRPPGLYEWAYLCGNAIRVAEVALVALWQDGQVKIAFNRQRVYPLRQRPTRHPIEAAALAAIPAPGRSLWSTLILIAADPAMAQIVAALRKQGLRPRRRLFESPHTRRMRKRLMADPGDGLRRVAVFGAYGVADPRLRQALGASSARASLSIRWAGGIFDGSVESRESYGRVVRLSRALELDMQKAESALDSGDYGGGWDSGGWDFGGWGGGGGDGGGS